LNNEVIQDDEQIFKIIICNLDQELCITKNKLGNVELCLSINDLNYIISKQWRVKKKKPLHVLLYNLFKSQID